MIPREREWISLYMINAYLSGDAMLCHRFLASAAQRWARDAADPVFAGEARDDLRAEIAVFNARMVELRDLQPSVPLLVPLLEQIQVVLLARSAFPAIDATSDRS